MKRNLYSTERWLKSASDARSRITRGGRRTGVRRQPELDYDDADDVLLSYRLLQQLEYALRNLVSLSQHSLSRLYQNVVLGVSHHLISHVSITDSRFSDR